ncbi:MAG: DUF1232 domain-containing protein [Alistipes sp.]|nr:DUF1232 domain-containing protein [Alistipes sp.]
MLLTISILVLAYMILGKDIKPLLEKAKSIDWRAGIDELWEKFRPWAVKVGRATARPLLQSYYVLKDENTSTTDRLLIYAAIAYTILPTDAIPRTVYKFLGVLDDGLAVMYVYRKIKGKITAEIDAKVDSILDDWFGVDYEVIE